MNVSVLGCGTWGSAVAQALADKGISVTAWQRYEDKSLDMQSTRRHPILTNFEFNFGDGSQTQNKDWENGSTVRYQWWRIYVMRKDSDELIIPFSGPAYYYAGWNPGQGSQLRMTVNNFDSASAFTIALTFATASASYYCSPQAGQARFYKKE